MLHAGFPAGSEYLWNFYYTNYWDYTQRTLPKEVDPSWDGGPQAGNRSASPGSRTATPTTSSHSGQTRSRRWREWR